MKSTRDGFTLVEVLVTLLLALALILPISRVGYMVVRNTQYARQTAEALAAGQAQLEQLSETDYDSVLGGTTMSDIYTLTWTMTEATGNKQIVLTISWPLAGQTKTMKLATVISD